MRVGHWHNVKNTLTLSLSLKERARIFHYEWHLRQLLPAKQPSNHQFACNRCKPLRTSRLITACLP